MNMRAFHPLDLCAERYPIRQLPDFGRSHLALDFQNAREWAPTAAFIRAQGNFLDRSLANPVIGSGERLRCPRC
jgi:hypothetical protein